MNIVSVITMLMILMVGVIGMKRGILKELVVVVGTVLVFFIAFILKDFLAAFFCKNLPFFHFLAPLGGLSSLSILFYQLIAFLLIVIILQFALRILINISGLIGKVIDATIILALPNKILGFIAGLLEGYVIAFIILNVLTIPLANNQEFKESKVREYIVTKTPILSSSFGGINNALEEILILEGNDVNKNNLAVIDTLLKYKVVSVDFMEELVKNKKMVDIDGVDAIIAKYR